MSFLRSVLDVIMILVKAFVGDDTTSLADKSIVPVEYFCVLDIVDGYSVPVEYFCIFEIVESNSVPVVYLCELDLCESSSVPVENCCMLDIGVSDNDWISVDTNGGMTDLDV